MRVGLREANQRFSTIIRAVKAGQEVVLTERGRPVAVIRPLPESSDGDVQRLEAAGLLRAATKRAPMARWRPRPIQGAPLSDTLREERESS